MEEWTIERLSLFKGDRRSFSCGDVALDAFFHVQAGQYERRGVGRTYVAAPAGGAEAAGYYTMANASVSFEAVPINLPRHPIPTVLIGRLAVDVRYRGKKLGEFLLFDGLRRALRVAEETAVFAVEVDAYESAVPFYARYGFRPFSDDPRHLFIPMKEVAKLGL